MLPSTVATDHAYVPANTTLFSLFCYPHVSADLDPLFNGFVSADAPVMDGSVIERRLRPNVANGSRANCHTPNMIESQTTKTRWKVAQHNKFYTDKRECYSF
jgi:hypothetical protein